MRSIDRLLGTIGWLGTRLGLDDVSVTRWAIARAVLLVGTCLVAALLTVDYARAPTETLQPGDVAPRTVKAPVSFS